MNSADWSPATWFSYESCGKLNRFSHSAEVQNGDLSSWFITLAEHRQYKAKSIKTWDHHSITKEYKLSLGQVDIKNTHTDTILYLLHIQDLKAQQDLKVFSAVAWCSEFGTLLSGFPMAQSLSTGAHDLWRWANVLHRNVFLLPSLTKGKGDFFLIKKTKRRGESIFGLLLRSRCQTIWRTFKCGLLTNS